MGEAGFGEGVRTEGPEVGCGRRKQGHGYGHLGVLLMAVVSLTVSGTRRETEKKKEKRERRYIVWKVRF